ncbi:hypothetical protein BT93_G2384 [Corymbia citriodora subsp. variegata]|nr:hypothetical protein BT93_G2384 [Corymbia citriodora subsp. variegata]
MTSANPQWKQVVFVSFGADSAVKTFVGNLYKRLNQVGIGYFKDKRAIPPARFVLVVLSKSYVSSDHCLNELVEILNCQRKPKLVVIPIFYMDRENVSKLPSDDKFERAFKSLDKKKKDVQKKKWTCALAKAKEISGYELKAANGLARGYVCVILTPC